jgi:general secretion pathway protein A
MYENFFSLIEKPFKLVPNPAYLFLSKSHEEALAHLNYAMAQGDGFVEITGEVGTGKTTLCRTFLENLDAKTIAAYIFNPRLGPKQLIKTINDELGIKYDTDNTKDLIDKLNAFLMRQKSVGKKVILLIDEAQNLSRNILEQLRLLSNLETNQEKLLQIILVGQPELSDILDSHELRQLGQRITLRYFLTPLNFKETVEYIKFRINIAARKAAIKFDRSAFRQIYRYSGGIPRVINIACDRALLTAFGLSQHKITGSIAKASIKELKSRGGSKRYGFFYDNKAIIVFAALALVLMAVNFRHPLSRRIGSLLSETQQPQVETAAAPGPDVRATAPLAAENDGNISTAAGMKGDDVVEPDQKSLPTKEPAPKPLPSKEPAQKSLLTKNPKADIQATAQPETLNLMDYLETMEIKSSRQTALKQAMELWRTPIEFKPYLNSLDDDRAFFRLTTKPSGIFIHRLETSMELLKRLNLPAILECYAPGSEEPGYLTLSKIDGNKLYLGSVVKNRMVETDIEEIKFSWSGIAYLPWKNFLSIWGTIPLRSSQDSIITLKLLLQELGFENVDITDEYDAGTRNAIEGVQAKYGIPVDGYVGPLTKIILYREKNTFEMPVLAR